MTTSHPMSKLLKRPEGGRIPDGTLDYIKARNRRRAFDRIKEEFSKSGISRAELATRAGKGRDQISRLLGQPGNVTIDTMAELVFASTGGELRYEVAYPQDHATTPLENSDATVPLSSNTPRNGIAMYLLPPGEPGVIQPSGTAVPNAIKMRSAA